MEQQIPGLKMGIRELDAQESQQVDLGPLQHLKGEWAGKPFNGWNVISVPGPAAPDGFVLEVIPYREVLSFKPVVVAGNRGPFGTGGVENTQHIAGLLYEQRIFSVCETANCAARGFAAGQEIHAERGIFLYLQDQAPGFNIARLSTIPHGNSVLAMGKAFTTVPPNNDFFGTASTIPIPAYGQDQFNAPQFPQFNQKDPNTFLRTTLGNDKINAMTTLVLDTTNPDGGILNIPFITDNVKASSLSSIFWIETIEGGLHGRKDRLQLQYTQTINLIFPPTGKPFPVTWPHVTINTLEKV